MFPELPSIPLEYVIVIVVLLILLLVIIKGFTLPKTYYETQKTLQNLKKKKAEHDDIKRLVIDDMKDTAEQMRMGGADDYE